MNILEIGTVEKIGGTRTFGISVLSGKNGPFENFGGTEELRKQTRTSKQARNLKKIG